MNRSILSLSSTAHLHAYSDPAAGKSTLEPSYLLLVKAGWPYQHADPTVELYASDAIPSSISTQPVRIAIVNTIWNILAPMMCTMGTVAEGAHDSKTVRIGSGIGHGQWRDDFLARKLQTTVDWHASRHGWGGYEWTGLGKATGGGILCVQRPMEKGTGMQSAEDGFRERVLALYLPSGCEVQSLETKEKEHADMVIRHAGEGLIGIVDEGLEEEVVQHIILTCVAIEEQVLRCRGWNRPYHAW